jgi:hypothetical protein
MAETASQTVVLRTGGRFIEYLFGRNLLIGLASLMLLIISGYATWSGMNDFIIGASSAAKGRALPGGFSVSHTHLVVAVTIALTFLMWIALRESIGKERKLTERLITFPLYVFLVLWSVGFGYGFWWSLIAGEEATRTGLSALQEDARDAGAAVAARLDAVRAQIESVAQWSDSQMTLEETRGGSCGVTSGAGRGPLFNARRQVRDAVASIRDGVTKSWIMPVQAELELLRKNAAGLEGDSPEDRQRRFEAMASEIRGSARNIASRSNELGKATANSMRGLADQVSIQPSTAGFTCFDPQLAQRLRQAADQAAEPARLQLRNVVFNEGPAGVANAVKNLWTNMGTYFTSLATYVLSGGKSKGEHTSGGEPITGRDMIALLATIGIDLGLFVLALLDRPAAFQRRDALEANQARLHLPSPAVVRQLAAAFQTAIARAGDRDLEWVRQHFIHHEGASYYVIPNLYGVVRDGPSSKREEKWALALNQLAGVMEDVRLVRTVTKKELDSFLKEEMRTSLSDLSKARREWHAQNKTAIPEKDHGPIRNHGLLSKAERALDIAGWSAESVRDLEVYRITDTDGLTPLLSLLNDATLDQAARTAEAASAAAESERPRVLALPDQSRS